MTIFSLLYSGDNVLTSHRPCLALFVVSGFPQTVNIWQQAASRRPRSIMRRLALNPGSVSFVHPKARHSDCSCSILVHEPADGGDFHVTSVCFNPSGRLLATGAEDGIVRVRFNICPLCHWAISPADRNANTPRIFCIPDLGYCQGANPRLIPGSYPGSLLARFLMGRQIDRFRIGRSHGKDLGCD